MAIEVASKALFEDFKIVEITIKGILVGISSSDSAIVKMASSGQTYRN